MSQIENMLHRRLPAWEPTRPVTSLEFYTFIAAIAFAGIACLLGFHRWL